MHCTSPLGRPPVLAPLAWEQELDEMGRAPTLEEVEALEDPDLRIEGYREIAGKAKDRATIAEAYLQLGRLLDGKGKGQEALECFRKALECSSETQQPNIHRWWAHALDRMRNPEEAERHFREGGEPILSSYVQFLRNKGELKLALEMCGERPALQGLREDIRWKYAWQLKEEGKLEEALEICGDSISGECLYLKAEIHASRPEWRSLALGDCLAFLQDRSASQKRRIKVLDLAAELYKEQGNTKEEHRLLQMAISCDPVPNWSRSCRLLHCQLSKVEEEQMESRCQWSAAKALRKTEPDKALPLLNALLKTSVHSIEVRLERAQLYIDQEQFDLAREDVEQVLQLTPPPWEAVVLHGRACKSEEEIQQANQYFRKVWNLMKKDEICRRAYIRFLIQSKQFEEALGFTSERDLGLKPAEIFYDRIWICFEWEKWKDLKQWYEENRSYCSPLHLMPWASIQVWDRAARAYEMLGDQENQYCCLRKAADMDEELRDPSRFEILQPLHCALRQEYIADGCIFQAQNERRALAAARASSEGEPQRTVCLYRQVPERLLSAEDQLKRAMACLAIHPPDLDLAKENLYKVCNAEASLLTKAEAHLALADACARQEQREESLRSLHQGWTLLLTSQDSTPAARYIEFLCCTLKESTLAMTWYEQGRCHNILPELFGNFCKVFHLFDLKQGFSALAAVQGFLEMAWCTDERFTQRILTVAIDISLGLGDYEKAKKYAWSLYSKEHTPHLCFQYFENYKKYARIALVAKDLKLLIRNLGDHVSSRIECWTECLRSFQKDLCDLPYLRAEILWKRGRARAKLRQNQQALEDLQEALGLIQGTPVEKHAQDIQSDIDKLQGDQT